MNGYSASRILAIGAGLTSALLLAAVVAGEILIMRAAILMALAWTMVAFAGLFLDRVQKGDRPRIESHWGGFGGGLGGWVFSESLVYLAATLVFSVLLVGFGAWTAARSTRSYYHQLIFGDPSAATACSPAESDPQHAGGAPDADPNGKQAKPPGPEEDAGEGNPPPAGTLPAPTPPPRRPAT